MADRRGRCIDCGAAIQQRSIRCRSHAVSLVLRGTDRARGHRGFKPGHPIGARHRMGSGYWSVKVAEPNVWEYEHRAVFIQHFGDIPEGHVIHHVNGDKADNRVENLALLHKRDHDSLHAHMTGLGHG